MRKIIFIFGLLIFANSCKFRGKPAGNLVDLFQDSLAKKPAKLSRSTKSSPNQREIQFWFLSTGGQESIIGVGAAESKGIWRGGTVAYEDPKSRGQYREWAPRGGWSEFSDKVFSGDLFQLQDDTMRKRNVSSVDGVALAIFVRTSTQARWLYYRDLWAGSDHDTISAKNLALFAMRTSNE
jgi:hypothetical protein